MAHRVQSVYLQLPINSDIMNALAYGLNYSKSLVTLQLSGNLSGTETSNFAKAIARNVCLEELDLSDCTIDTQCLGILGFALRINRTIRSIVLDGCYLEDENLAHMLSALQDSPALKSLSVQRNYCHEQSMSMISSLLHYDDIEELNMSYLLRKKKEAQPEVVEEGIVEPEPEVETPKAVPSNESKEANEQNNDKSTPDPSPGEAEEENATAEEKTDPEPEKASEPEPEPENLAHNTSLKNLQLAANGLNDGFIESTLKIFGKDSALEELNLFGNRMTDLSMHRIIGRLPDLRQLKSLWIGHNNFTIAGYSALLLAMQRNFVLEELSIVTINTNPEIEEIQNKIDHYTRLNRGGRRIFASNVSELPKSIWPLILERANRIEWDDGDENDSKGVSYSADAIFCLLQGPALLDAS
mmetsp:Transcript_32012/g.77770  ORF Transcript_32012/g.77770 Transcript_32012/m.77770 type:complete len:413 (-) Transcript_32012:1682-2920(-)